MQMRKDRVQSAGAGAHWSCSVVIDFHGAVLDIINIEPGTPEGNRVIFLESLRKN